MKRNVVLVLLLTLMALLSSSCARPPEIVLSGPTMGTTYTVKVVAAPATVTAARLLETIDDVLTAIDRQMSGYRPDSELTRFNAFRSTEWIDVSPGMVTAVSAASRIAERSGGALDITVAPLVAMWGFGPGREPSRLPDEAELQAARQRVGFEKLATRADPPALRKKVAEVTIDLNAIAPGYAVDLMMERLGALGIENCMVDIGGEIRVRGRNERGEAWRVAVEKPHDGEPEPYLIVQLDAVAIATSGEYRHAVVRDGRRLSHTIDPRTARPVEHDLASVAVISGSAMEADAWATAFNVLGPDRGYELAQQQGIAALFIRWEGVALRSRATLQFEKYVLASPD